MFIVVSQSLNSGEDETLLAPKRRGNQWRRRFAPVHDLVNLDDDIRQPSEIGMPSPFLGEGQSPEEILSQIESAQRNINMLQAHIHMLEQELRKKSHGEV